MKCFKKILFIFSIVAVFALVACDQTPEHTHVYGDYKQEAATHSKECECGDIQTEAHTYGDWVIISEATEETDGSKKRTCTVCSYEETEVVPKLTHVHAFDKEVVDAKYLVSDATCSAAATYKKSCSCGLAGEATFTKGEALGHTWNDATCEAPKTCSVCNETEGEAIAHTGNLICEVCKNQIPGDDFVANLVNTETDDITLKVSDFKLVLSDSDDEEVYADVEFEAIAVYLSMDEDYNITGYGSGVLTIISEGVKYDCVAEVAFQNEVAYVYAELKDLDLSKINIRYSSTFVSNQYAIMKYDLNSVEEYTDFVETIEGVFEEYGDYIDELVNILDKFYTTNEPKLHDTLAKVIDKLCVVTKTTDGYTISLSDEALTEITNDFIDKPIAEAFDATFGDGAYADVEAFVLGLFDLTVEELVTELQNAGLSLDEIFDLVERFIAEVSGSEEEINLVDMILGEDHNFETVVKFLLSNDVKTLTLLEFVKEYFGLDLIEELGFEDVQELKDMISSVFDMIKNKTIIQLVLGYEEPNAEELEEINDIQTEIKDIVKTLLDAFSLELVTDSTGKVLDLVLDINEEMDIDGEHVFADATLTISTSVVDYSADLAAFIEKVEGYTNVTLNNAAFETVESYYSDDNEYVYETFKEFIYDGDQIIGFVIEEVNDWSSEKVEGRPYRIEKSIYTTTHTYLPGSVMIEDVCGDNYDMGFQFHVESTYSRIYEEYDENGSLVYSDNYLDEKHNDYTTTREFKYNSTTKTLTYFEYEELHNFVEDENLRVESDKCEECSKYVYKCSDCGIVEYEFDYNRHQTEYNSTRTPLVDKPCTNLVHVTETCTLCNNVTRDETYEEHNWMFMQEVYTLAEGSETCEDGLVCKYMCKECGYVEREYNTSGHFKNYEIINFDAYTDCEKHYFEVAKCPCGYDVYVNFNFKELSNEYDNETNTFHYTYGCEECNIIITKDQTLTKYPEQCLYVYESDIKVFANDELIYQITTLHNQPTLCEKERETIILCDCEVCKELNNVMEYIICNCGEHCDYECYLSYYYQDSFKNDNSYFEIYKVQLNAEGHNDIYFAVQDNYYTGECWLLIGFNPKDLSYQTSYRI